MVQEPMVTISICFSNLFVGDLFADVNWIVWLTETPSVPSTLPKTFGNGLKNGPDSLVIFGQHPENARNFVAAAITPLWVIADDNIGVTGVMRDFGGDWCLERPSSLGRRPFLQARRR
jgi:hypothetical protein